MTETTIRGIKGMKTVMDMPVMQVRETHTCVLGSKGCSTTFEQTRQRRGTRRGIGKNKPWSATHRPNDECSPRPNADPLLTPSASPVPKQDGPPPGGYPSVRYARRIPSTGPTGVAFFGAYLGAMVYGFYQVGQGNARRRGLREEKNHARAVLIPFLQAEEDRRYRAAVVERTKSEDKIMAGVPGWKSGDQGAVYNTTWLPPQHTYAPRMI